MRITTFNLENLFNRYVFLDDPGAAYEKQLIPRGVVSLDRNGRALAESTSLAQRNNTARALLESKPDVLVVQEVEDIQTLRSFNSEYLDGYFDRILLVEGNDGRGINVGVLLKRKFDAKIIGLRSHVDDVVDPKRPVDRWFNETTGILEARNALFSRDCLEVDIDVGTTHQITVLANHLKSQAGDKKESSEIRRRQAEAVARMVIECRKRGRCPIVVGDLNEDWTAPGTALASLKELVDAGQLGDPFDKLPEKERWSHYYAVEKSVSRLDYILVGDALASSVQSVSLVRKGLTLKCNQAADERYPTVGYVGTEASDHCPVTVEIQL